MPKRDQEAPEAPESKKHRIASATTDLSRDKVRKFLVRALYNGGSECIEEYWKDLE